MFSVIAAVDENYGIGKDNALPWRLPGELAYFTETTLGDGLKQNVVVMGYNTWISLPEKSRPLKGRKNIVLAFDDVALPDGVVLAKSIDEALAVASEVGNVGEVFFMGGASIYKQAVERPECKKIYLTEILKSFDCDTFFPKFSKEKFILVSESNVVEEKEISYKFVIYENKDLV